MANALAITADDFGLAHEVNDAVELAHRQGVLSAASLMVAGPAAEHAIAIARRLPSLRVGLHIVLVEGAPASPPQEIAYILDKQGALRTDLVPLAFAIALRAPVRQQIAREIEAQFTAFRKAGLVLDHVNAHKHFHVHPPVARPVIDFAIRHDNTPLRVPYEPSTIVDRVEQGSRALSQVVMAPWVARLRARARAAGLLTPDAVFGLRWSGAMTAPRLKGLLSRLPPGFTEIYTHPATSNSFPGHAAGYRYTDELAALADPEITALMRDRGIRAGGYRDAATAFIG